MTDAYEQLWPLTAVLGYYSPVTRAWQFGVGVIAALIIVNNPKKPNMSASVIGGALLVRSFFFIPPSSVLPGPITILPMAAIFLLLLWQLSEKVTNSAVMRPLAQLGDRSDAAYLWHWPLWSALAFMFPTNVAIIEASFSGTLLLAHLTHRFIEQPFIRRSRGETRHVVAENTRPAK